MLPRRTWCQVLVAPALLPIAGARPAGRVQVPASRPDSFDARAMRARVQQALDQNNGRALPEVRGRLPRLA